MCRLIFDTDALRGTSFEVQLASYSQSVPSDHKIQILHAMQVYAGQEDRAEVLIGSTSTRYTMMSPVVLDANFTCRRHLRLLMPLQDVPDCCWILCNRCALSFAAALLS